MGLEPWGLRVIGWLGGFESVKDIVKSADLSYDYFLDEARSIVRELEKGETDLISEDYVREKVRHVLSIFKIIEDEKNRQELINK